MVITLEISFRDRVWYKVFQLSFVLFHIVLKVLSSVHFSHSVMSPTLCDPMNHSTPGLPVHHQLLEFTLSHVHRVGDAIQPSHPLSSPSLPASNPSQHQSFFQWVNSSHEVAKVLEFSALASFLPKKSQGWSPSGWTGWISLQSKGLSRVSSRSVWFDLSGNPFFLIWFFIWKKIFISLGKPF